jgi:MFS transporter, DHA1 family, multidrug resistance protein
MELFKKYNLSTSNPLFLAIIILSVTAGQFALLFYIPALPKMANDLGVSNSLIQDTIVYFSIGFGISQLFYGVLSDSIGRKRVLLMGLSVLIAGILCTYFSTTGTELLISRLIQGLGAGACAAIPRAILRESFDEHKFFKAIAIFMLVLNLMPAVAPFIGGGIIMCFSWQTLFLILLGYIVLIFLIVTFFMPETHPEHKKIALEIQEIKNSFINLFSRRKYFTYVFCIMLAYSGLIMYLTFTSFIYENSYHFSPGSYGVIMIVPAVCLALGSGFPIWIKLKKLQLTCTL